jgi:hypothetical protein
MAGARVVVVVCATEGAELDKAVVAGGGVAGVVVAGVVGTVTGAGAGVGAVVTEVTAAVAGCAAAGAGFETWRSCPEDPVPRAATVPPTPPITDTMTTPAPTILFLMDRMVRGAYQPEINVAATSPGVCRPGDSGTVGLDPHHQFSASPSSVHSSPHDL